ncbi:MAG: bacteriohemerythrin [Candidatus Scalindua sp.]
MWNDKHNVNIPIIDEEYRKFIDIVNKAIVAKQHNNNAEKVKDVLKEMTMYALRHYSTEEAYMIEFDYPESQHHKEEHHVFTIRTIAYPDRVINGDYQLANEILEYLQQCLASHIQVTDKKYVEYIIKKRS